MNKRYTLQSYFFLHSLSAFYLAVQVNFVDLFNKFFKGKVGFWNGCDDNLTIKQGYINRRIWFYSGFFGKWLWNTKCQRASPSLNSSFRNQCFVIVSPKKTHNVHLCVKSIEVNTLTKKQKHCQYTVRTTISEQPVSTQFD